MDKIIITEIAKQDAHYEDRYELIDTVGYLKFSRPSPVRGYKSFAVETEGGDYFFLAAKYRILKTPA